MTWTFANPSIAAADGHIDAACIYGADYAQGGFCNGIIYDSSNDPEVWAVWFSTDDFDGWNEAVGFSSSVVDTQNWRLEDGYDLTTAWTIKRWLPIEARNADYYSSEYRF